MRLWKIIKKTILFLFVSMMSLIAIGIVSILLFNESDSYLNQDNSNLLPIDSIPKSLTYQNIEIMIEVEELGDEFIGLKQLLENPSLKVVSSVISPSSVPGAVYTIEINKLLLPDFLNKLLASVQVKEIKTYTDNKIPLEESVDSWIDYLSLQEKRYLQLIDETSNLEDILAIEKELLSTRIELDNWNVLKEQHQTVTLMIFVYSKSQSISWQDKIKTELGSQFYEILNYFKGILTTSIVPYIGLLIMMILLGRFILKRRKNNMKERKIK